MGEEALHTVIIAVFFGVLSYTIARYLRYPAILFYLVSGILLGPLGFKIIDSQHLGTGLLTLVEIGVAIILFEGGLNLPSQGFLKAPTAIRRILLLSIPLTGIGAALLGHWLLDFNWKIAAIFGALIVVTGPTVIGPLLKSLKLAPRLEVLLKWEAIWGDVIGVLLIAVALEFILLGSNESEWILLFTFLIRIAAGIVLGVLAGYLLGRLILPWVGKLGDAGLPGVVSLAFAMGVFLISNKLISSSGPLAVTVAGFVTSHLRGEMLHDIRHFKDQVASLFISTMFVLLSAYINPFIYPEMLWPMILVAVLLGVVVRPVAVLTALVNTGLSWRERFFVGAIGPRGIVALASASYAVFVMNNNSRLETMLLNTTFITIFLSGTLATVLAKPLARILRLSTSIEQSGIIIAGINPLSISIARFAKQYVPVKLIDTNPSKCQEMHESGFDSICVSALSDDIYEEAAEEGFGRVIAMTTNDALNTLIVQKASTHIDYRGVYVVLAKPPDELIQPGSKRDRSILFRRNFYFLEAVSQMEQGIATIEERHINDVKNDSYVPLLTQRGDGICLASEGKALQGLKTLAFIKHT